MSMYQQIRPAEIQGFHFQPKCIQKPTFLPVRSASHLTERSGPALAQITTPKRFKTQPDVIR